jgi:stromal membrane-associated protein
LHGKQASPQPKVEPPVPKIVSPPQPEKSPAKVDTTAPKVEKPSVPPPPKVDYVIDLFNMLSMDETTEKESESSTNDGNAWDGFQCKLLGYIFQWTYSVSYVAAISLSVALPL